MDERKFLTRSLFNRNHSVTITGITNAISCEGDSDRKAPELMEMESKDVTEQHECLVRAALEKLQSWRRFLIGIDGKDHSGKSTLARYLAWQMDMPVIETDLFLIANQNGAIRYDDNCLKQCIDKRLGDDRPVIVEGVFLLKTLERLRFTTNYLICIQNHSFAGSDTWQDKFKEYENQFTPKEKADFRFSWKER